MTPPICNDCRWYIKQSPGFCKRLARLETTFASIGWLTQTGRLPRRWRVTEARIMGRCGINGVMWEKPKPKARPLV